MLVLSRKVGEVLRIGENIRVMLCSVRSDQKVRLGVEAPPEVNIVREELLEQDEDGKRPTD